MDFTIRREMSLTLKCVCLKREEFEKINDYYRYIGVELYDKEEGGVNIVYFHMKKYRVQCINEHLDTTTFEDLPIYICEIVE